MRRTVFNPYSFRFFSYRLRRYMFLVAWVFSLGEIVTFSNLVSVRSSHLTHVRPYCVFVTPKPGPREVKNESNQVCFDQ